MDIVIYNVENGWTIKRGNKYTVFTELPDLIVELARSLNRGTYNSKDLGQIGTLMEELRKVLTI